MEEELLSRFKTVKERVRYLMEKYPETRNDDRYLILLYLRYFTSLSKYISFIPYRELKKIPSFETIRRVRQKIQEEGDLLPTDPKVLERRKRRERAIRRIIHEV